MASSVQRAFERLVFEAGYDHQDARSLIDCARRLASESPYESEAILMGHLKHSVGNRALSHGDQVWVITRRGVLVTLFFRRSSQRCDEQTFGVEHVSTDERRALWEAVARGVDSQAEQLRDLSGVR